MVWKTREPKARCFVSRAVFRFSAAQKLLPVVKQKFYVHLEKTLFAHEPFYLFRVSGGGGRLPCNGLVYSLKSFSKFLTNRKRVYMYCNWNCNQVLHFFCLKVTRNLLNLSTDCNKEQCHLSKKNQLRCYACI